MKQLYISLILGISALSTLAQPGNLDPSFGNNGFALSNFITSNYYGEKGNQVLLQENGGMLVAVDMPSVLRTVVARYLPDGSLDNKFGFNGFSQSISLYGAHAALQRDGKIIIAGSVDNISYGNGGFAVARLHANGHLDESFGQGGIVKTDFNPGLDEVRSVAIQSDGKIVVGGITIIGSSFDAAIARYNTNGSLDNTFSGDGKQTLSLSESHEEIRSIAIQDDGKIIAAGHIIFLSNSSYDILLVRYQPDGTPDNTFGSNGVQITDIGPFDKVNEIVLQEDGKIVTAGATLKNFQESFAVARFTSMGMLDPTFNGNGKQIIDFTKFGNYSIATSVKIQQDRKIVVAGYVHTFTDDFALARLNENGSLDLGFGSTEGKQVIDRVNPESGVINSVTIRNDGKIVTAGTVYHPSVGDDFALLRFNDNGSLDQSFGSNGFFKDHYPYGAAVFYDIAVQSDGKLVTTGFSSNQVIVARYLPNGVLDNTFSGDGKINSEFSSFSQANSVAIQNDGKIVVAGALLIGNDQQNFNFLVARYNVDGTLDPTFAAGGWTHTGADGSDYVVDMALQKDGKILLAGSGWSGNNQDFAFVRYNNDGTLDNTFGEGGKISTDFGGTETMAAMLLQQDGKFVTLGSSKVVIFESNRFITKTYFLIARYNPDGSLDPSFAASGRLLLDMDTFHFEGRTMALQPDGKIIVAGNDSQNLALIRISESGDIDGNFGTGGRQVIDLGGMEHVNDIVLQSNGKIIVAGYMERPGGIVRFNPDGSIDNEFGNNSTQIIKTGAEAVVIDKDRLYTAGFTGDISTISLVAAYQLENPAPVLTINNVTVSEGQGYATLTINLSQSIRKPALLAYTAVDGTAKHGQDYHKQKGIACIPAGSRSTTLSIRIKEDNKVEGSEYFDVQLYPLLLDPQVVLQDLTGRITITDKGVTTGIKAQKQAKEALQVQVSPNPSSEYFNLQVKGSSGANISIKIVDAAGRLIETKVIGENTTLQLGQTYRTGMYWAEVIQGNQRIVVPLLKTTR